MERWNPESHTYHLVFGPNGEFVMYTMDFPLAWKCAKDIHGWLGETTFAKPMDLNEVFDSQTAQSIEHFLAHPETGVRRERPTRKPDIDEAPFDCNPPS